MYISLFRLYANLLRSLTYITTKITVERLSVVNVSKVSLSGPQVAGQSGGP
jgi:hypothetical protein